MSIAIETAVEIEVVSCGECGVAFGLPRAFREARVRDHKTFFCPNGHQRYYAGETETEKLRKALELEKRRTEFARNDASAAHERAVGLERRVRALKGRITLTKKRIADGACPCCSKRFADLRAHIAKQHPAYHVEETR